MKIKVASYCISSRQAWSGEFVTGPIKLLSTPQSFGSVPVHPVGAIAASAECTSSTSDAPVLQALVV